MLYTENRLRTSRDILESETFFTPRRYPSAAFFIRVYVVFHIRNREYI